jgi:hypothetical protein
MELYITLGHQAKLDTVLNNLNDNHIPSNRRFLQIPLKEKENSEWPLKVTTLEYK